MSGDAPLDGILVVSMEQAVAAPYCASRLADAGARVIKIERAEGDFARRYDTVVHGESAYFVWLNRGKESLVADIKDEGDRALLRRIIDRADVFIQNLAPGAAARAGYGSEELRRRNPRLVTVDISGYGAEGEYSDMKTYDLLVQAESGLCSNTAARKARGGRGFRRATFRAGCTPTWRRSSRGRRREKGRPSAPRCSPRWRAGRRCRCCTTTTADRAEGRPQPFLHPSLRRVRCGGQRSAPFRANGSSRGFVPTRCLTRDSPKMRDSRTTRRTAPAARFW